MHKQYGSFVDDFVDSYAIDVDAMIGNIKKLHNIEKISTDDMRELAKAARELAEYCEATADDMEYMRENAQ